MSMFDNPYEKDPGWIYLKLYGDKAKEMPPWFKTYDSKKSVWIPDKEEGYIAAEIKSTKGDIATVVTCKGAEMNLKKDACQEMNPPKFERTDDMSNLSFLNDASVLNNLRSRYGYLMIYTYSGLFCVVINPYKRLPIYTESVVKMFMGKRKNEMPPHLFAASDEAYRNMLQDRENQSMLITGESGAGKTENTKKVISYFAVVGATQAEKVVEVEGKHRATLEEQIVQTNPVLESFGNAKTVRNNNSSRFGKFIRVHFDKTGKMAGGDIEHYLLEKSRAIKQNPGERCYHIFYQIMSGWNPDLRKKLILDHDVRYYHFVSQAEVIIDGMDDVEEMKNTDEAFDILGFSQLEKDNVYRICAALMHMGEMKFKQRGEQAEPEDDIEEAKKCCACFGIPHDLYLKALTSPRVKVGTEWVNKGQTVDQVNWGIGAMTKGVYSRQFTWLVKRCNKTLDACVAAKDYFIGVLDIAGFEIFDFNSFEQMWINFVNERLQQFFNHHMFVLEQEEYKREGIVWEFIDFGLDLAATIELIEKPLGIISMLDEECIVPKASDSTYAQKLNDQHLGKHPSFIKPPPPKGKQADAHFAIKHYAGMVRYNVTAWLEKNKDPLNDTCVQVMKNANENALLQEIWSDYQTQEEAAAAAKEGKGGGKKGKSGSFMTVSMLYREGLNNLMNMLNKTHPHFVRCIIPNELKKSGYLDAGLVLNQLTCNGVLEGIRICKKGFPNRMAHPDFKQRYSILAAAQVKEVFDEEAKVQAAAICDQLIKIKDLTAEQFRVGKTKVFFKAGVLAHMEDLRDAKIGSIMAGLQARIRFNQTQVDCRRRLQQQRGLTVLQRNISSWLLLRTWNWFLLFGRLRPNLKCGKMKEEMAKLKAKIKVMEASQAEEEKKRKELDALHAKLLKEKNDIMAQLQSQRDGTSNVEDVVNKLEAQKKDLEKQITDLSNKLSEQEDKGSEIDKTKKKIELDMENLKKQIADCEGTLEKSRGDTAARDEQIKNLQDEMAQQDELIARLNKEKKHQDEVNRKVDDDSQVEGDKYNHLNKVKAKLEQQLDELEDHLEREKRVRQDIEKVQRKVEAELRLDQEKIDELTKRKQDIENNLRKKEQEIAAVNSRVDDERSLVAKLQKQLKELQIRVEELDEELAAERQARSKAEKNKSELQRELDELSERLDEAGGLTAAQLEIIKKREAELAKLRKDFEEANQTHEGQLGALRKKHNDSVVELGEQMDQMQKHKAKLDKDKTQLQRELDDLRASLDAESKAKQNADKTVKVFEVQIGELQAKHDENVRQLAEFASLKGRMTADNAEMTKQIETAESTLNGLNRSKAQLTSQLEEAKHTVDDEIKQKQTINAPLRTMEHETNTIREQIEEQVEARAEVLRQLSKVNSEIQLWRTKFESEGLAKTEELEDSRKKIMMRIHEVTEQLEQANQKIQSIEKARHRLAAELEDAQADVEKAHNFSSQLEKKQKGFDKISDEWKRKFDDLKAELEGSQKDNRNLATEAFKLKGSYEEICEQFEVVKRENKSLCQETKDLSDQLGEGGKSVHELQKLVRRLELEKEELQAALDEAEAALEAEESKVLRTQIEVSQIRSEIEKKVQEKEEEFENTRKLHQRALESLQGNLESEVKGKTDLLRVKKKLESDINDLELALDHANHANGDAQKNIKLYQEKIREMQNQVEVEQHDRAGLREQCDLMEKKAGQLFAERQEVQAAIDQVERARKQAESTANEARDQLNDLGGQNNSLAMVRRQLETELQSLHADLDDTFNNLRATEEQTKKAMMDASRLAEELRAEQEHSTHIDRMRKSLEAQCKDMQLRLDEAEQAALKGGKKVIGKLEQRIKELESELDSEQRRYQDSLKISNKQERTARDIQFNIDENRKNQAQTQDLIDKLQQKIKTYKKQVEEAEESASVNFSKFRQIQQQVDEAVERADMAENSLEKLRVKARSSTAFGGDSEPANTLSRSVSSGAVLRSPSRLRANRFD